MLSGYAVMWMHVEMIAGQGVTARVVAAGGTPARRPPACLPVRQTSCIKRSYYNFCYLKTAYESSNAQAVNLFLLGNFRCKFSLIIKIYEKRHCCSMIESRRIKMYIVQFCLSNNIL